MSKIKVICQVGWVCVSKIKNIFKKIVGNSDIKYGI